MAFLFQKFQEAVKTLAKSPMLTRDPRHLQFEADVNRLFLYTCYNRLGRNADEKDADEVIEMATKASISEQQKQVQENIHEQFKFLCSTMDDILLPDCEHKSIMSAQNLRSSLPRSGLSLAIGRSGTPAYKSAVPNTKPLTRGELSQNLQDRVGYTIDVKPSQILHEEAGHGLFLSGEADVGALVAFYPGMVYSPAYYSSIPGYPKIDARNSYLITRYDGTVIDAQPWGHGGGRREVWDGSPPPESLQAPSAETTDNSYPLWKMLAKPSSSARRGHHFGEVLERRNPLAFGHFANHPSGEVPPNVMICPYDFPMSEENMRVYIPNIIYASEGSVSMKRFGNFWFKTWGSGRAGEEEGDSIPAIKALVLIATRGLCDEELLLNYRLSNSKKWPEWYSPVDEEEDRRRWS